MVLCRLSHWAYYTLILVSAAYGQERVFGPIGIKPATSGSPPSPIKMYESRTNGVNYFYLQAPASLAGNIGLTFPSADGSSGQCLGWASANTLAWASCGGVGSGITSLGGQTGATQTFSDVDDTNVTLSWSSATNNHALTAGWTGTLAKARMVSTTVHTDQANGYSSGLQDFSVVTMKIPISAGCSVAVTGLMCVDSTSHTLEVAVNNTNKTVAFIDGNIATATALAANPTDCGVNEFATGIAANGNLTCATPAGSGNVSVSGSTTTNNVPFWAGTGGTLDPTGYAVSNSGTANALARYGSAGGMTSLIGYWVAGHNVIDVDSIFYPYQITTTPVSNATNLVSNVFANNSSNKHASFRSSLGVELSYIDYLGRFPADKLVGNNLDLSNFNGGSGASSSTFWRGDRTWATPGGSGNVSGPGSSTNNYYPQWNGSTGTILQGGKAGAATNTVSTVMERDSFGASASYDKGGQVYNVKAYGAVGDCSANDTTAIQNAINAAQDDKGGIIFFPGGCYGIQTTLTMGNGTPGTSNTKRPVFLVGVGSTDDNNNPQATEIRWTGSTAGSAEPMIKVKGPYSGGGIRDILFYAQNSTNRNGLWLEHVAKMRFEGLTFVQVNGGPAVKMYTTTASVGCSGSNIFAHIMINTPGTNGEGMIWTGGSSSSYSDSCSNVAYGGSYWGTTYGLHLQQADGNHIMVPQLNVTGTVSSSVCGLKFSQDGINNEYPTGNFIQTAPMGMCGTHGTGYVPNYIIMGECGYSTQCNAKTAFSGTMTNPFMVSMPNTSGPKYLYGQGAQTDSSSDAEDTSFWINNTSGSHQGTGALAFRKLGVDQCKLYAYQANGFGFSCKADGGSGSMTQLMQMSSYGELTNRVINRSTINTYNSPVSSLVTCVDCALDSSCSYSAGGYAIAFKKTAGIGLANWTCNFQ